MRAIVPATALSLLALTAGGCASERTAPLPPTDRFVYPTAVLHQDGAAGGEGVLYVASANFDLKYQSGTLSAVALDGLVATGGLPRFSDALPPTSALPVDVPDLQLGAGQQVAIPSLSGLMDAYVRPGQPARLFVATRGERSQVAVVEADGAQLSCSGTGGTDCTGAPLALSNGEAGGGGEYPAAPAPFGVTVDTLTPGKPRVWVTHMEPAYTAASERIRDVRLYLVTLDAEDPRIPDQDAVEASRRNDSTADDVEPVFRLLDGSTEGGSGTAANSVAVAGPWAFVTGRTTASGTAGNFVAANDLVRMVRRDLTGAFAPGVDAENKQLYADTSVQGQLIPGLTLAFAAAESRGIAVSSDQRRLYVTTRAPDALMVVSVEGLQSDSPDLRVERIVPLPDGAGEVRVLPRTGRGDLVAVSCSTAGALALYDTDVGEVLGLVTNMGQDALTENDDDPATPDDNDDNDSFEETYALTVDLRSDGPAGVEGARLYLASFDADRVAVVDVKDLTRPQDARVVARLGTGRPCPSREQGETDCRTGGQK